MAARTLLLAGGAFAVGTSAYVVSGVLPDVSAGLGVSLTAAGQLATVFALSYAVSAPLLATLTGRWERRTVLLVALGVAALGNAITALAVGYPLVLGGRAVAALGSAMYIPAATVFATALLPAEARGRAVARVFAGLTVALVLGVPAGNLLAGVVGFRGVFGLVAVASAVFAGAIALGLPRMIAPQSISVRERLAAAADRRVLTVLAITVLGVLAAMSVYIYLAPLLAATADVRGTAVSVLLGCYGIGAFLGNALGGRATDRFGSMRTLLVATVGFVALIATLPLTGTTVVGAAVALFAWSTFTWAFNPPMQNLLLQIAPAQGALLLSLNASAIYLGIGLSGVVGGLVIGSAGVLALPAISAILGVASLALLVALWRGMGPPTDSAGPVRAPALVPQPADPAARPGR